MKNISAIFRRDLYKIAGSPVAMIILAGIIVIPSLYAWFNIAANWDPYSNTKNIAIAVANEDVGTKVQGETINAGAEVVKELGANDAMDWTFVNKSDALAGVKDGRYYAAVVIPSSFSANMASILTGTIKKPTLEYYLNEKTNAIANKMTNVGIDTVQTKVNQAFVETVVKVVGTVLNVSADKLTKADPIDSLVTDIDSANQSLTDFQVTLAAIKNAGNAANSAMSAAQSALSATRTLLPDASQLVSDGQRLNNDANSAISSGRDVSNQLSTSLNGIVEILKTQSSGMTDSLTAIANDTSADANDVATRLESLKGINSKIIEVANKNITILEGIKRDIPVLSGVIDPVLTDLRAVVTQEQTMADNTTEAARKLRQGGTDIKSTVNQLVADNKAIDSRLSSASSALQSSVTPALDAQLGDVYDGLDDLSSTLSDTSTTISDVDQALGSVGDALSSGGDALASGATALDDVQVIITRSQARLTDIRGDLAGIKSDARWGQLMNLMTLDADTGAAYMASPVQLETTAYYPVANYGAAMTPFYTTLCLWVGALVLVAILKTNVKNPQAFENIKPWEMYFGRYMIFLVAAILQALVACLGNCFLLHVVMVSPIKFLIAGIWTSMVYSFFVYTLTVAFDEVGKAIAVLIMVIQVAGSGGTFPIQVLPEMFQKLNPYMAFTYSIGAMREAVAGCYGNYYMVDLLKLLGYVAVSLLIGLVLRKPLIRLNEFFKERLESTGIM